jgi:PAS domain S-box-containing protein
MFLAWGPELALLYNDDYASILGNKHPGGLGRPFAEVWSDIWTDVKPLVDRALAGESTWSQDLHLVMERQGYFEDTWWTFSYSPVRDETGQIAGMFCACAETSRQVEAQRLLRFKLDLNERLRQVSDPVEVTAVAAEMLGRHLGVARVGYGEIDPEGTRVTVERDWTDGSTIGLAGEARPLDSFGPQIIDVLRRGETLVLNDVGGDARSAPYAEGYASIDARSMIVAPLVKAGRLTAILYLHEPARRRWTASEIEHVQAVAGATWAAVERARAEASLREREQRLTLIQAAGGVGSFDWDMVSGRIHRSREYLAIQGLAADSPSDDRFTDAWMDRLHPEDRDRVVAAFREDITLPGPFEREYRIVRPDTGEVRWINNRGRVDADASGRPVRLLSAQTDITERKRSEAALTALATERETILSQLAEGVVVTDAAGRITFVNDAAERLHGVARLGVEPDAYAKTYSLFTEDGRPYPSEALPLARAVQGETVLEARWRIRRPDGSEVLAIGSARPLRSAQGLLGAVLTLRDDTERHAAEARLRELNETLEQRVAQEVAELARAQDALRQAQKMEAVGQLTGGIAHDFNNLLTAVVGGLDIIMRRGGDERTRKLAANALEAAERGVKLTGQLLAFSRTQRLTVEPVEVNALVEGMRELIAGSIGGGVKIRTELSPEVDGALTDANQLELAILNLCINARDAMEGGGAVTVRTAAETIVAGQPDADGLSPGDYVVVSVTDEGPGMTPDVLARAFDPFFTTKPVGQGTGLGLSQVYGIALQSGGTARIDSRPGDGTTVRLYLPKAGESGARRSFGVGPEAASAVGARRLVLVVDDDPDVRRFVVDSLDALGFRVLQAADGPSGLALFEQERPELLLLDFAMPGMTGADVAQAARAVRPAQPILFVSGHADTAALEQAAGDAAVLRKPFRMAELGAAVEAALVG